MTSENSLNMRITPYFDMHTTQRQKEKEREKERKREKEREREGEGERQRNTHRKFPRYVHTTI